MRAILVEASQAMEAAYQAGAEDVSA
jgi:hypothetical protein